MRCDKFGRSNERSPDKSRPHKGTTKDDEEYVFIEKEGKPSIR